MKPMVFLAATAVLFAACSSAPQQPPPADSPAPQVSVPAELLAGEDWLLSFGKGMAKPYDVTLQFGPGSLSGQAPVNRYSGSALATPEGGLEIGPLVSTEMAGPKPRMAAEEIYYRLLEDVDGWQAGDGQLFLSRGDELLLRYAQPGSPGAFGITLIGLPVKQAKAAARAEGYTVRVIEVDGEPRPATMDYRTDRLNLTVADGRVTQVDVG